MHGRTHRVLIECSSQSRPTSDSRGTRTRAEAPHRLSYGVTCGEVRSSAVPSGPAARKARWNARRRTARSTQVSVGCTYAPRPGSVPRRSGTHRPSIITTRSRSRFATRSRHPTQVRSGHARTRVRPDTFKSTSPYTTAPPGVWPSSLGRIGCRSGPEPLPGRSRPRPRPVQACSAARPGSRSRSASAGAGVSGRMSIRQPVSRAASRAFCPSFPIASDSW